MASFVWCLSLLALLASAKATGWFTEDPTGTEYRGELAETVLGLTCQDWSSQSPHQHSRTAANYPDAGLEENYCRNPDNAFTAWCYTTDPDVRWQYCALGDFAEARRDPEECYTISNGRDYRGIVAWTRTGKTCQKWTSQSPHGHSRTPANYPNAGLGNHNLCRNPDGEDFAWCYTTDPNTRWEYCDIGLPRERCP